jgi:hypothetical protein
MRKTIALATLLTLASQVSAQTTGVGTFRSSGREGPNRATVILKTKVFDASKRRVSVIKDGEVLVTKVDGRTAYGTDGGVPAIEIESLRLFINGREVPIPRRLYSDCFNPRYGDGALAVKFGGDPQTVFVFMHGSDGAGVYDVVWVLRRDGRHSRFAAAGGDCSLFNYDCGLFQD